MSRGLRDLGAAARATSERIVEHTVKVGEERVVEERDERHGDHEDVGGVVRFSVCCRWWKRCR